MRFLAKLSALVSCTTLTGVCFRRDELQKNNILANFNVDDSTKIRENQATNGTRGAKSVVFKSTSSDGPQCRLDNRILADGDCAPIHSAATTNCDAASQSALGGNTRFFKGGFVSRYAAHGSRNWQRHEPESIFEYSIESCDDTCAAIVPKAQGIEFDAFIRKGFAEKNEWSSWTQFVFYNLRRYIVERVPHDNQPVDLEVYATETHSSLDTVLYWPPQTKSKLFAVFLYPTADTNLDFRLMDAECTMIQCLAGQQLHVIMARVSSVRSAINFIRKLPPNSIHALILAGHGSPTSLRWGEGVDGKLTSDSKERAPYGLTLNFLAHVNATLTATSHVFLDACGTAGTMNSQKSWGITLPFNAGLCFQFLHSAPKMNLFKLVEQNLNKAGWIYASTCKMHSENIQIGSNCMPSEIKSAGRHVGPAGSWLAVGGHTATPGKGSIEVEAINDESILRSMSGRSIN